MNHPVPIASLDRRLTEQGRIRLGALVATKSGNGTRPSSIDTFRFTSHDKQAIEQLAQCYGGKVETFAKGSGQQWEVITDATEVDVVLLADAFHQAYEMWQGSVCQRRCDGDTVQTPQQVSQDEWDWAESPCICIAKDEMECKLKSRLTVMLPAIRFGGGWRLETSSVNAAMELREMVNNIQALANTGLTRAKLALEQRQVKGRGGTKNFVVPVLRVEHSLDQMLDGAAALRAPEQRPALQAAPATAGEGDIDPDPIGDGRALSVSPQTSTAPVVEEPEVEEVTEGEAVASSTDGDGITDAEVVDEEHDPRVNARFHAILRDMELDYETLVKPYLIGRFGVSWGGLDEARRVALVESLSEGKGTTSSDDMRLLFAKKVRGQ